MKKSFLLVNILYLCKVFNIISRKALLDYIQQYPSAATALSEWYYELLKSDFQNYNDLKNTYPHASLVGDDRVVFNIKGNNFRLIVRIVFIYKTIQIKWFGSLAEYNKIDVLQVNHRIKRQ